MSTADVLAKIVKDAGYVAAVDGTYVPFRVEGTPYRFETIAGDDGCARLVADFAIPHGVGLARLLVVANEQNRTSMGIKTVVDADAGTGVLSFRVELPLAAPDAWGAALEPSLAALRCAFEEYCTSLNACAT